LYLDYNSSRYAAPTALGIRKKVKQNMTNVFIQRFKRFKNIFIHIFCFLNVFKFFFWNVFNMYATVRSAKSAICHAEARGHADSAQYSTVGGQAIADGDTTTRRPCRLTGRLQMKICIHPELIAVVKE